MNNSASTLNYFEIQNYQVRNIPKKQPRVLHATTNQYIDISKKKFLSHIQKLDEIRSNQTKLQDGIEDPSELSIRLADIVIEQLEKSELLPAEVVASAEGGVAFCFMNGDKYADIECLNSGEILAVTTNRRDRPSVWEVQLNQSEIARATERIRTFITK